MKRYVIFFYTAEEKAPEFHDDLEGLLRAVNEYTKRKAKFAVYEIGGCIGDFS